MTNMYKSPNPSSMMLFDIKCSTPEKYLDANSECTTESNAEYYRSINKNSIDPVRYGFSSLAGGEVASAVMPIYAGYVPVRFLCEMLGYDVQWDGETKTVYANKI